MVLRSSREGLRAGGLGRGRGAGLLKGALVGRRARRILRRRCCSIGSWKLCHVGVVGCTEKLRVFGRWDRKMRGGVQDLDRIDVAISL